MLALHRMLFGGASPTLLSRTLIADAVFCPCHCIGNRIGIEPTRERIRAREKERERERKGPDADAAP